MGIMRVLAAISFLLVCAPAWGWHLDYFSGRKWVEQQGLTNTIPQGERLFVGRITSPRVANIIQFHKGVRLREIIDQTPLKGKVVKVCVMWPDRTKMGPFTRHAYITVGPTENPDCDFKPLDLIWLYDDGPVVET